MTSAPQTAAATLAPPPITLLHKLGRLISGGLLLLAAMALVAVVVAAAGGLRLRVEQTGSMAPTINKGDLVIVRQATIDDVRLGDVIGVKTQLGQVIVHRVKAISGTATKVNVKTQGDANPTGEDWTLSRGSKVVLVRNSVPRLGAYVDAVKGPYAAIAVLLAGVLLALGALRAIWSRP